MSAPTWPRPREREKIDLLLADAVMALPARCREIIVLHKIQGLRKEVSVRFEHLRPDGRDAKRESGSSAAMHLPAEAREWPAPTTMNSPESRASVFAAGLAARTGRLDQMMEALEVASNDAAGSAIAGRLAQ